MDIKPQIEPIYVTYTQAILLKAKGFDAECETKYELSGKVSHLNNHNGRMDWNTVKYSRELFSRPEQWQVVEWLRVRHGIWIEIHPEDDYKFGYALNEWQWDKVNKTHFCDYVEDADVDTLYDSPQGAYSDAINYVLTKLI